MNFIALGLFSLCLSAGGAASGARPDQHHGGGTFESGVFRARAEKMVEALSTLRFTGKDQIGRDLLEALNQTDIKMVDLQKSASVTERVVLDGASKKIQLDRRIWKQRLQIEEKQEGQCSEDINVLIGHLLFQLLPEKYDDSDFELSCHKLRLYDLSFLTLENEKMEDYFRLFRESVNVVLKYIHDQVDSEMAANLTTAFNEAKIVFEESLLDPEDDSIVDAYTSGASADSPGLIRLSQKYWLPLLDSDEVPAALIAHELFRLRPDLYDDHRMQISQSKLRLHEKNLNPVNVKPWYAYGFMPAHLLQDSCFYFKPEELNIGWGGNEFWLAPADRGECPFKGQGTRARLLKAGGEFYLGADHKKRKDEKSLEASVCINNIYLGRSGGYCFKSRVKMVDDRSFFGSLAGDAETRKRENKEILELYSK